MARPGRKPKADTPVAWRIYVPTSITAEVDLRLLDPVRGRTYWGAKSELVSLLLLAWLRGEIEVPLKSHQEFSE